jgi:uncharacterized protein YkwD
MVLAAMSIVVMAGGSASTYLSPTEQQLVDEMNLARTYPRRYADYLVELRQYYDGDLIRVPGEIAIQTREGVAGIDEAIRYLRMVKPAPALIPSSGMSRAARDHVRDQGLAGLTNHRGTDGSHPGNRLNRYGEWLYHTGENIAYGPREARRIVINQIIDDGVKSRGHRENLFNPAFKRVGVACGEHANYRYMCVMELAAGYTER